MRTCSPGNAAAEPAPGRRTQPRPVTGLLGVGLTAIGLAWAAQWHLSGRLPLPLPGCLWRKLWGIPCPSCGMTRSLAAWARLDPGAAFRFHPLCFLACVALLASGWRFHGAWRAPSSIVSARLSARSHMGVLTSKTRVLTCQSAVQTSSALAELALLTSSLHLTLTSGLSETCALQTQLTHLLTRTQRPNACLTQCIGSLQAQLGTLDAVLSLHLLVRQSGLHGLLSIHALSLQRSSLILHRSLLLCGQVLSAHSESSLLVGERHLQSLLCVQALCLQLRRHVLYIGLLLIVEVGQSSL